jgi:hypothetical protein
MFNSGCDAIITNCTFSGNLVPYLFDNIIPLFPTGGGAMYNGGSDPTITNCTFTVNFGYKLGGAILNSGSEPEITNCTFTGNYGKGNSLACDSFYHSPSNVRLTNCILWDGWILNWDESIITVTYSNVPDGWLGEGNIKADPYFAGLLGF